MPAPRRRRRRAPRKTEEKDLQLRIIAAAEELGWKIYHVFDSRGVTSPGFPDIIAYRDNDIFAAELKSSIGRVRPEQVEWLLAFNQVMPVFLWRPEDWSFIVEVLTLGTKELIYVPPDILIRPK